MGIAIIQDLTLQQLVLRLVGFAVIIAVHGFVVAAVAAALGDPGPRHDGRLTINPMAHLDLVGTASGVLFSVGWIRPFAIDSARLRSGRFGLAAVVAAGCAAPLVAVMTLRAARPFILPLLPDTAATTTFALIETTSELGLWFALINVLPVPPLTGAHLLEIPAPSAGKAISSIAPYAGLAFALAAATGIVTSALRSGYHMLATLILGGIS